MTDLKEQLRVYFDEISPPFDTADLKHEPLLRPTPVRSRVGRGVLVAAATAALILLFAGLPFLFSGGQDDTVVEPPATTFPPTTIDAAPTTVTIAEYTDPAVVANLLACLPLDPAGWSQSEPLRGAWTNALRLASSNGVAVALVAAQWDLVAGEGWRRIDQVIAYWSTDGLAWERAVVIPDVEVDSWSTTVAGGPRGFVMVADAASGSDAQSAPIVAYSDDGATWKRIDPENLPRREVGSLSDVVAGPDGFIILGESGEEPFAWYSADGRTWAEPEEPTDGFDPIAVVSTDSGWIAVTQDAESDAERWESTDGTTWDEAEIRNAPPLFEFLASPQTVVDDTWVLVPGHSGWVDRSEAPAWVSDDRGTTWNKYPIGGVQPSTGDAFHDLDATSFGLLGASEDSGGTVLHYSQDDGSTWQDCRTPEAPQPYPAKTPKITQVTTIGDTLILFNAGTFHTWTNPTATP